MQDELNSYKYRVATIWDKLTSLLELAKKRRQEKKEIAELISTKKDNGKKKRGRKWKLRKDKRKKESKDQRLI